MTIKSLQNCREVSKSWMECIDNQNILWKKVAKIEDGKNILFLCRYGYFKIVEFLIKKTTEFKIDLRLKDKYGMTALQYACNQGDVKIFEAILQKSVEINADLNTKDNFGLTAFHWACMNGHSKIVAMLIQKSAEYNVNLNTTDEHGKTAFY